MIKKIHNKYKNLDIHTLEVIKKSFSSMIVKVGGVAIGLLVSIALGRLLGADGLGVINLSNRIVNILIIFGLFGSRQFIVKKVAIAHNREDFKAIGNIMHSAYLLNGGATLLISIIAILLTPWLTQEVFNEPRLTFPLTIFILVLTPQVFSRIISSGLIGYRKIWQSNLVEQTLSIVITGILLALIYFLNYEVTINKVAIIYAIGRVGVTIAVAIYWNKVFRFKSEWNKKPKQLFIDSTPLFLAALSAIIISNSDTVFLGIYTDSTEIGLYSVALSIASLTSFFLQITNASVGPKIAALYNSGKITETQEMVKKVTRGLFFIGLLSVLSFLILGKFILGLWGEEFKEVYPILIILSFGQLINIGTGAVGQVLIMTGYEKQNKNIMILFMFFNLLLNLILIKFYGITGAAIANAVTIAGMNLTRVWVAKKKANISTI